MLNDGLDAKETLRYQRSMHQRGRDMFKIDKVNIENFRSIGRSAIPLHHQLTVFVGDNGTGKTAILDAVALGLDTVVASIGNRLPIGKPGRLGDFRIIGDEGLDGPRTDGEPVLIGLMFGELEIKTELWLRRSKLGRGRVSAASPRAPIKQLIGEFGTDANDLLPIVVAYGEDRAAGRRRDARSMTSFSVKDRLAGYEDALDSRAVYAEAVHWFEAVENFELREQRERGPEYQEPRLRCVRRALELALEGVRNPRMVGSPPRLVVDETMEGRRGATLPVDQLSSGYRVVLALTMDLARRMATLNPDMADPLESPGIVLIDEVDLHLHPKWQQSVVPTLLKTFPNVQFVLTTHSPQILTTIDPDNIRILRWSDGELHLDAPPSTDGAKSGRLLEEIMGVEERPPARYSEFVTKLEQYRRLVREGGWDSDEAKLLFDDLGKLSPDDPELIALAFERERFEAQRRRSRS